MLKSDDSILIWVISVSTSQIVYVYIYFTPIIILYCHVLAFVLHNEHKWYCATVFFSDILLVKNCLPPQLKLLIGNPIPTVFITKPNYKVF